MCLGKFILINMEQILQEWQDYASTFETTRRLSKTELRDHAKAMLLSMVKDIETPQSNQQVLKKSKGDTPPASAHGKLLDDTAAQHALQRFESGLTIQDLVSEFRSLRASVLRLWEKNLDIAHFSDLGEMTRFNESIDQALAESVDVYAQQKERCIRLFETVLLSSPDHNYILDLNRKFLYANKAMAMQCNCDPTKMVDKSLTELGILDALEIEQSVQQLLQENVAMRGEVRYRDKTGDTVYFEYILTPIMDANGIVEAIAGTERDITARKAAEDLIWHKANYDTLTELPNRRLFRDRLDQQVMLSERTGIQAALLFIDLDQFKEANDKLGHDAGDELLKQAATRIRACIRQKDTVARLGGDEFTVILADFDGVQHAEDIAKKVLRELAKPFHVAGKEIVISGSIGISIVPDDAICSDHWINNADQAMYQAKHTGRNNFKFFHAL